MLPMSDVHVKRDICAPFLINWKALFFLSKLDSENRSVFISVKILSLETAPKRLQLPFPRAFTKLC